MCYSNGQKRFKVLSLKKSAAIPSRKPYYNFQQDDTINNVIIILI